MYFVYIIRNEKGKHYIGITTEVKQRLQQHNSHSNRSTKYKGPWELIYQEEFGNKKEALIREKIIKAYKGGNAFKKLLRRGVRAV